MNFYVVFEQHYIFCCVHSSIYNLNKGHFMHKKKNLTKRDFLEYFGSERLGLNHNIMMQVQEEIQTAIPLWQVLIGNSFLSPIMQDQRMKNATYSDLSFQCFYYNFLIKAKYVLTLQLSACIREVKREQAKIGKMTQQVSCCYSFHFKCFKNNNYRLYFLVFDCFGLRKHFRKLWFFFCCRRLSLHDVYYGRRPESPRYYYFQTVAFSQQI